MAEARRPERSRSGLPFSIARETAAVYRCGLRKGETQMSKAKGKKKDSKKDKKKGKK